MLTHPDIITSPLLLIRPHPQMASVIWLYFFSKVIEFLDTFFFILRKKDDQITLLHVYHHSTMVMIWWMVTKWFGGGNGKYVEGGD